MDSRATYAAAACETWAILPRRLSAALAMLAAAPARDQRPRQPEARGGVAILPVHGVISQRESIWSELFGGTSTQALGAAYVRAVNDPRVSAVVLDVDSPGGTTAGVQELGDILHQGAREKPTYAVANSLAASAAYWIASQAGRGRFYAAPGAEAGSIGVYRLHESIAGALQKEGIKISLLAVPRFKAEANPFEELTAEGRDHHLQQVSATYDRFVEAVARGRGTTAAKVRSGYGEGRTFHAEQAAALGLVDGVKTLPQLLGELGATGGGFSQAVQDRALAGSLCDAWRSGIVERIAVNHRARLRQWQQELHEAGRDSGDTSIAARRAYLRRAVGV